VTLDNDLKVLLNEIYTENKYEMDRFEAYYNDPLNKLINEKGAYNDIENQSVEKLIENGNLANGYNKLMSYIIPPE